MSEYGFNDYDEGSTPESAPQAPKWFREKMDADSKAMKEMREELTQLRRERQQSLVAKQLEAQGYAPGAAALYTGEPDGLNGWLETHGAALARLPQAPAEGAQEGQEQSPAGPPPTTVDQAAQDQMRLMQEAGTTGVAPPQGTEAELVAQLKNASPEQFAALMRANGNQHF